MKRLALAMSLAIAPGLCAAAPPEPAPPATPAVDFDRDVRPILQAHCHKCHGPTKQQGGLRLDSRQALTFGGDHGSAIDPQNPAASRILRRVTGTDPDGPRMPYKQDPLTGEQVRTLDRWIAAGTPWPAETGDSAADVRPRSEHWAFQPVKRPAIPAVKQQRWLRTPVDRFVLAKLESRGIKPSPEADRATLIRRLSLDLLGLPPEPEEIDAFLADTRPGAYERLVDRLLSSQHYGERWGRHWLDQARYADSNGYSVDAARSMWPYRDWVIHALNADMPFDRFTIEQLAGDLLPGPTRQQRIATGFHRNTLINQEGGSDPEQFRNEAVVDRVNTTGAVWLGLTLACAQCHTHKFDPITQREYYQLFAFFNSGADKNSPAPVLQLPTDAQATHLKSLDAKLKAAAARLAQHDASIAEGRMRWEAQALADEGAPGELHDALKLPADKRTARHKALIDAEFNKTDSHRAVVFAELSLITARRKALLEKIPTTMVMADLDEPRPTHLLIRGDFLRPGPAVEPGVPQVLPPLTPASGSGGATRLDLARWLVSLQNPLTPRVVMNRLWMRYFAAGLVETENDLGAQGTPPSHPELLDYLAAEFVESRWSLKAMHRLIVTSAVYRQSSADRSELRELDPLNKLLARQNRVRVEAEIVRDLALAVSGRLSRKVGGPSVYPHQPEGVYAFTQVKKTWKPSTGEDAHRRTLYTFIYRSAPHPMLTTFDAPDFGATCTRRLRSNTPLQALTLANDVSLVALAQHLAARQLTDPAGDDRQRMAHTFRRCLGRHPGPAEIDRLMRYLRDQHQAFEREPSAAAQAITIAVPAGVDQPRLAAWTAVCRVLMNLDEFITRP